MLLKPYTIRPCERPPHFHSPLHPKPHKPCSCINSLHTQCAAGDPSSAFLRSRGRALQPSSHLRSQRKPATPHTCCSARDGGVFSLPAGQGSRGGGAAIEPAVATSPQRTEPPRLGLGSLDLSPWRAHESRPFAGSPPPSFGGCGSSDSRRLGGLGGPATKGLLGCVVRLGGCGSLETDGAVPFGNCDAVAARRAWEALFSRGE